MNLSLALGLPLCAGALVGVFLGWASEWSTRLALRGIFLSKSAFLWPSARLLTLGFYVTKQAVLGGLVYLILWSLHLSLMGFAAGILAYQLYRVALMIFWPSVYLGQRTTS
jgi:hypothetical protein